MSPIIIKPGQVIKFDGTFYSVIKNTSPDGSTSPSLKKMKQIQTYREQHLLIRSEERLNFDLTDSIKDLWLTMIKNNETVLIKTYRDGKQRHLILYNGLTIPVGYDPKTKQITTVLPHGC